MPLYLLETQAGNSDDSQDQINKVDTHRQIIQLFLIPAVSRKDRSLQHNHILHLSEQFRLIQAQSSHHHQKSQNQECQVHHLVTLEKQVWTPSQIYQALTVYEILLVLEQILLQGVLQGYLEQFNDLHLFKDHKAQHRQVVEGGSFKMKRWELVLELYWMKVWKVLVKMMRFLNLLHPQGAHTDFLVRVDGLRLPSLH